METSSTTIKTLSNVRLESALSKSQNCLSQSQSGEKATDFIQQYVKSLKQQAEEEKNEANAVKKSGDINHPLQGKGGGGLNLRPLLRTSPRPTEKFTTPTKKSAVSPPTNGRTWVYADVVPKENLLRKPLHPERSNDTNAISSSPNAKAVTPVKSLSTSVIVSPHTSNSSDDKTVEKYAVCPNCGALSKNFTFCEACQKALPVDVKMYYKSAEPVKQNNTSKQSEPIKVVVSEPAAKRSFYGRKLSNDHFMRTLHVVRRESALKQVSTVTHESVLKQTSVLKRAVPPLRTKSRVAEPVCLTISSDDDDEDKTQIGDSAGKEACFPEMENMDGALTPKSVNTSKANPRNRLKKTMEEAENLQLMSTLGTQLKCRSVRIGSFKIIPTTDVVISPEGIFIETLTVQGNNNVHVHICPKDLVQVMCHFSRTLPILFLYTTPGHSGSLRNKLKMSTKSGPCYDPCSGDESKKRITLLPERLTDDQRILLTNVFSDMKTKVEHREIMMEIDSEAANAILVRSTPMEQMYNTRSAMAESTKTVKMMTYPPPPQMGGITITSDDFSCLEEGQFLNDVIIDFYLKFLVQNKLSEKDRERTHIFSSFFYRRLTQRPGKRHIGTEDEQTSLAENRHSRVKTWTRHVDIFEKDYIIIPINENSHWFLAVICFPYLDSPVLYTDLDEVKPVALNVSQATVGTETTNVSMNETTTFEDGQMDEAMDCSQHSFESEEPIPSSQPESPASGPASPPVFIAQPCILIFDSLPGPSRGRLLTALREYLRVEWYVKKKTVRSFDRNKMKGASPTVPLQSNYSDCGIYLLQYVESFFETPISNYSIPIKGLQNWFSDECVNLKRAELRKLITSLMIEQHGKDLLNTEMQEAALTKEDQNDSKDENQFPDTTSEDS